MCTVDGNFTMPGKGVRLGRIGALHTSETPILLPSRIQVCTPHHQRQMDLYAQRPRRSSPLPATPVANCLHHLQSHRFPPRRHLSHRHFIAVIARQNLTPTGPTRYHHHQILYTYYYLLLGMMPTSTTITLVLPTKMRYF